MMFFAGSLNTSDDEGGNTRQSLNAGPLSKAPFGDSSLKALHEQARRLSQHDESSVFPSEKSPLPKDESTPASIIKRSVSAETSDGEHELTTTRRRAARVEHREHAKFAFSHWLHSHGKQERFMKKVFGIGPPSAGRPFSRLIHPLSPFAQAMNILSSLLLIYIAIVVQVIFTAAFCSAPDFVLPCVVAIRKNFSFATSL